MMIDETILLMNDIIYRYFNHNTHLLNKRRDIIARCSVIIWS